MASADRDVLRYLYRSVSYPQASKDGIQLKNLQRLCEKQNLHLSMSKILKILNDHPQFFRCFQDGLDITVSGRTELGLCDDHCRKDGCLMTNGECNGLHLCKFHILDTCSIQPETRCRYGHRWDTYHNKVLLSRHMLDGMPVNTVSLFLRPKLLPKICKYYNIVDGCRGGITGDKCPALHLCKHFITGQCKYEQECTRSHNVFDTQPRMILKKHGINVDGSPKRIVNQLRAAYESNDDGKMSYEVGYGEDHANLPIGSGLTFDTYPRHEYQKQNPREIPNVCMYYLQDACTSGESCPDVHCPTLFQWQYEDTNGDWVNVTGDANADIEINFCEPNCDTCYADVQGLGIIKVDLVSLSARVENGTELKVRRLGTQSCQVVPDWLHEFATKWMWFIEDDTKSWQEYGKVVINATLANIGSPNIEQATGLPHYGHILAGTVKDVVTRWAHQSGMHVDRRFGWDTHGLPVEYEIDKTLGIKGPEDVAKMGIKAYNAECRKIVMRYAGEWETIVSRLGRWIDFKNDYKTLYPSFMESIWWVFKQLYNKGLVYKGCKVMPFSTECSTPLSNFESGQNYKDVQDPAVVVSFPLEEDQTIKILAWTTTPWTLPSNLTLCVHPDKDYIKLKDKSTGEVYIMMEARVCALYKTAVEYDVVERFKGSALEGKKYVPIFDYFAHMGERGAFRVLNDTYVTEESGTGVVHQAPYFGEDDYRCNLKYNIITKDMAPLCPVDMRGRFTDPVVDFKGLHVKEADKHIMKLLKERGRLVHQSTMVHSYPFCWRSDSPLIYRAVPSWFVRVEQLSAQLLASNAATYWVPDFVKEKRFGNWLRDARDWAISRNRYWGTPIPLWVSDDGEEVVCIGSIEELMTLTGAKEVTDIHRENVDCLTIPSKMGKGVLRRVPEVFDCWFESGSMPYAQNHFPFEKKKEFEDGFPGDFIAEGIDQTRGWFYTLQVLGTALFGKAPFKNLICHGLVLAADGQKMSKRKKNYPDPMDVVNKYGADAVRLYLINSPVVRADNLRFKEEGVRDVLKDVFLPWYNAYRFLLQNIERLQREEGHAYKYDENAQVSTTNYMDRWILSFTQSLTKFVTEEMTAYRLYTVVPRLLKFVEQLTNWYVRMNRKRLKGEGGLEDCHEALTTLFGVLFTMVRVMAPFIPFLTEHMYQRLRPLIEAREGQDTASIHYLMLPTPKLSLIDTHIESSVTKMQAIIELGRVIRDRKTLPMKYPLKEVVVIHRDQSVLDDVSSLHGYIQEELNVKFVTTTTDKEKYGVHLRAEPDHKVLGARLKGEFKSVMAAIKALGDRELTEFQKTGVIVVKGHELRSEDLRLIHAFETKEGVVSQYEAHSDSDVLVLLDITPDQSMLDEGLAREVINRIQKLRKKAKLVPADDITVYYTASGDLSRVVPEFTEFICSTLKQPLVSGKPPADGPPIITESAKVKSDALVITIMKRTNASTQKSASVSSTAPTPSNGPGPFCKFVNVELCGTSPRGGVTGCCGTVLLENPQGDFLISHASLVHQVQVIFGLQNVTVRLYQNKDQKHEVLPSTEIAKLHSHTLYAFTH